MSMRRGAPTSRLSRSQLPAHFAHCLLVYSEHPAELCPECSQQLRAVGQLLDVLSHCDRAQSMSLGTGSPACPHLSTFCDERSGIWPGARDEAVPAGLTGFPVKLSM